MKRLILFLVLSGIFSLVATINGFAADEKILIFTNGLLIDGTGSDPISGATVILKGDKILAVGSGDTIDLPKGAKVIDLKGATILPGFINAHVHDAYNADHLEAWAREGVTTVRDMNSGALENPFHVRDQLLKDNKNARLVSVGPMLRTENGYGSLTVTSPEDAKEKVNDLVERGADLIKIGIEDEQGPRSWPLFSQEDVNAIVEVAHAKDVYASAHVSTTEHVLMALEAGVDDLAHMAVDHVDDELIQQVIDQDVYWIPTLELWSGVSNLHHIMWDVTAMRNLYQFVSQGGKIALGTDYDGYIFEFEIGMPMIEIRLMAEAGLTPMQIIVAATKNAAYVCGLKDQLGTIEKGKIADLLIVEGNPLEDLEVLRKVRYVVHNGELIRDYTKE